MYAIALLAALLATAADVRGRDLDRSEPWEQRMLESINADRAGRGLPAYRLDRKLEQAAAGHARRMAESNQLSHQLPGEPVLRERIAAEGLRFDAVAENVGYSTNVEDLHGNLMRSASHRQNLLSTKYDAIGIAIVRSGARYYVTQDFAHTTSVASAREAEDAFAAAIDALRRRRGLPAAKVAPSGALRDVACDMARSDDLDARRVPRQGGQRRAVVFTTFEPGELARAARAAATARDATRISYGACHRSTPRYPGGAFWFAMAY